MGMLDDEIALVTGASRGIGRAIARELARAGARVIGTATTEGGAAAIGADLAQAGVTGEGRVLDVGDPDAISALMTALGKEPGMPSILVNNAGITRDNLLLRMKDGEWDEVLRVDLTAVFRLCRACLRAMMKARHGRIINVTSVVALSGNPGQANYAAAKAGVIGFTKSLAREVGSRGITVNTIAPGFIDTDMTRGLPPEQRTALLDRIPLQRLGGADEVAHAAAFLASPGAGYITGETLHVNGGLYMA